MTPEGETIELMVKLYKDGKMSSFLSNLKEGTYADCCWCVHTPLALSSFWRVFFTLSIGDEVVVSDPEGTFDAANRLAPASDILLLAAGSGKPQPCDTFLLYPMWVHDLAPLCPCNYYTVQCGHVTSCRTYGKAQTWLATVFSHRKFSSYINSPLTD